MKWLPQDFDERWLSAGTVDIIRNRAQAEKRLPPIAFVVTPLGFGYPLQIKTDEGRLRFSLEIIGVLEPRSNGKINVPEIFRVAARIKRRGGVRPPPRARKVS